MTDFEERVSTLLQDAVPEPVHLIEPQDITGAAGDRRTRIPARVGRRRVLLAVAASVSVAAVALGMTVLVGQRSAPSTVHQQASHPQRRVTDPVALTLVTWTLLRIRNTTGRVAPVPDVVTTLRFDGTAAIDNHDDAGPATVTAGHIRFGRFVNGTVAGAGTPSGGLAQTRAIFGVLSGHATWFIRGDVLTISKARVGSLLLIRPRLPITAAGVLSCPQLEPGLTITPLPVGRRPMHDPTEVRRVVRARHVGPQRITTVTAAIVADPTGDKVGLPTTARVMWVVYGDNTYEPTAGGLGNDAGRTGPEPTPGTVTHTFTLVDDATLRLGGNFAC